VRIVIASDHAGFELKADLRAFLEAADHDVVDLGTDSTEPVDYPDFCANAAREVAEGRADRAIVLGGSGQGEQIAANKVHGIRAALVWSLATAELAREHNAANVIAIGARQHSFDEVKGFIDTFIATPFSGEVRHARRIAQVAEFETTGQISGHEIV
jgi:ribose 5-phosphate isomerase B